MKQKNILFGIMLLLLLFVGIMAYQSDLFSVDISDNSDSTKTCDLESPELTFSSYDAENEGQAVSSSPNLYRVKGARTWNSMTLGTALTLTPYVDYEVIYGANTTDHTDNNHGDYFEYTSKCIISDLVEQKMYQVEDESGLTGTFYDADDDASAETFTAGQSQTVSVKLQSGVDEYFGNPYCGDKPNIVVLELNSTAWDKPNKVSVDGIDLKSVGIPQRHTLDSTGNIAYAYELPVITDARETIELTLTADSDAGISDDGEITVYAGSWYVDADTGEPTCGVEDEDGNAVGTDAGLAVTLDFTS